MTNKTLLDFSSCMKIEFFLVTLIILFTVLRQDTLISFCFALSFIMLLLYTVNRICQYKFSVMLLLLIILAFSNVVWNASNSPEAQLGFDYFKKVLMFSAFMLIFYYAQEDSVTTKTYDSLVKMVCIAGLLLLISYFFFGNTDTLGDGIILGFSNPNFCGMWLLHIFIYVFMFGVMKKRSIRMRMLLFAVLAIIAWMIAETKARSCLIGLFVFCVFCLIGKLLDPNKVLNRIVLGVVILFPIVLVGIYHQLLNSAWFLRFFSFMVSEGKGLDSRLRIWEPALRLLRENIWLGDYCGISNGLGVSQLHNTHLDVLCSYGILPFLIFIYMLYTKCKKAICKKMNYCNYCAMCGFLAIIVMGAFEAAVVSGAMGMNILTAGLIVLANRPVPEE